MSTTTAMQPNIIKPIPGRKPTHKVTIGRHTVIECYSLADAEKTANEHLHKISTPRGATITILADYGLTDGINHGKFMLHKIIR